MCHRVLFFGAMNSRQSLWIALGTFGVVGLLQVLYNNGSLPIDGYMMGRLRWVAVLAICWHAWQQRSLTGWIIASMAIGFELGVDMGKAAKDFDVLTKIFIQLIKTAVGPLLFSTLVVGIAGQSSSSQMGRIALKAFSYFLFATAIALVVGLIAINLTKAGEGIQNPNKSEINVVPASDLKATIDTKKNTVYMLNGDTPLKPTDPPFKLTWQYTLLHTFPENVSKMLYEGAVLQIVVFSLLFGLGLRQVNDHHRHIMLSWAEALSEVMFKFVNLIMYFAPFAVGGALASTIGVNGLGVMVNLAKLLGTLYVALFAFVLLVFIPVMLIFRIPIVKFFRTIYPPASLAFATASSEAALPQAMTAMERFGVPRRIVSFVMPTGYSFNLDGSTLYLALASIFCAQAAGLMDRFTWDQQLILMGTLLLTSKGVAAVPRASLVILAATVNQFNIPEWPIGIILGVDALMDMGRTVINLMGNCLASAVVARWEGEFDDEAAAAI
jgi:proton glutamate symport protein